LNNFLFLNSFEFQNGGAHLYASWLQPPVVPSFALPHTGAEAQATADTVVSPYRPHRHHCGHHLAAISQRLHPPALLSCTPLVRDATALLPLAFSCSHRADPKWCLRHPLPTPHCILSTPLSNSGTGTTGFGAAAAANHPSSMSAALQPSLANSIKPHCYEKE
jgi:hypothetical protein